MINSQCQGFQRSAKASGLGFERPRASLNLYGTISTLLS